MPKQKTVYICQQCGYVSPQFLGRCPECGTWNSLVESIETGSQNASSSKKNSQKPEVVRLSQVDKKQFDRLYTSIGELDRVLGGGIVKGSVVLISGDPGIGKSTLLSQLAVNINQSQESRVESQGENKTTRLQTLATSHSVLYVAGEESAQQIKLRVDRIQLGSDLSILQSTDTDQIISSIETFKPSLVIIDSIQTLETTDLTAAAGSISQVKESAHRLQRIAKRLHIPIFIVGHVTKEGTVAGPRTLEHLVDVVLNLEGDPTNNFRILRAVKNRFGSTDEVGIFEMEESGMKEVTNPSKVFLEERVVAPGSAVTAILTGLRPMLLEIQALVTKTNSPIPRRVGTGIDNNRLQLLVAVLQKRLKLPLWDQDVFVNVTGGVRVVEPAADLAICMAIISSFKDITLPKDAVYIGEVGLLGELRSVRQLDRRINEAKKLGFSQPISPINTKSLANLSNQS